MFLNKPEEGIILMNNLKSGAEPMKLLDKTKIMTVPQAKVFLTKERKVVWGRLKDPVLAHWLFNEKSCRLIRIKLLRVVEH